MKKLLLALGLVLGLAQTNLPTVQAADAKAPDFALKDLKGKVVHLSDYKGKVVLLNFWATWCPPCRAELPDLVKAYTTFSSKGFVILGVSLDDDPASAVPGFLTQMKKEKKVSIDYPILAGDEKVTAAFGGIRGIPTTFLIDRKGMIRKKFMGAPGRDSAEIEATLRKEIGALL